jgi:UPF0755 protein
MHFDIIRTARRLPLHPHLPRRRTLLLSAAVVAGGALIGGTWLLSAPASFPANTIVTIPADVPAGEFGRVLEERGIVRSGTAFKLIARATGYHRDLVAGAYVFEHPTPLLPVLYRIGNGQHGIEPIQVTLTEGMTRFDIADALSRELPGFNREVFLEAASTSEGYLFPETYNFMPGDREEDIVVRLKSQFSLSIASITPQALASAYPFSDAVIMASILEREANNPEDMRIVAGILWNRLDIDMPLQVDAVFGYIRQENGYTPTAEDLQLDSPYNTYRNRGLPPTPISNPGLDALLAAVQPEETPYLYYLTGRDGKMYYGRTFEDHKRNRALYLD